MSQLQCAHGTAGITYAAAPLTQLQRAHGSTAARYAAAGPVGSATNVGRGGVFVETTPAAESTAGIIGGMAVMALVIALVAFLALGSRASRRGELAPVTSLVQSPSGSPATPPSLSEASALSATLGRALRPVLSARSASAPGFLS